MSSSGSEIIFTYSRPHTPIVKSVSPSVRGPIEQPTAVGQGFAASKEGFVPFFLDAGILNSHDILFWIVVIVTQGCLAGQLSHSIHGTDICAAAEDGQLVGKNGKIEYMDPMGMYCVCLYCILFYMYTLYTRNLITVHL